MTHGYLAGLAAGLLVGAAGMANAAMVTLPMELSAWDYSTWGGPGVGSWEKTGDGIKFYGPGYRQGSGIFSKSVENFSDATIYVKWMVHGGTSGEYMGTHPGLASSTSTGEGVATNYTTHHSFNGSQVLPQDIWLYTRIDTNPDMTWAYFTATGNYDDQGGSKLYETTFPSQSDLLWQESVEHGRLDINLGDNYGGTSAWALVAEAKYDLNAAPEPVTLLLFGTGILSLAGTRFRAKRK